MTRPQHSSSKVRRTGSASASNLNIDLLGRSFRAGAANVTVLKLCPTNPRQVIIERDFDGKSWLVPAGLIRLILQRDQTRQAA